MRIIYFPLNIIAAGFFSIFYCFFYYRMKTLGKLQAPLFAYSLVIRILFIVYLTVFTSFGLSYFETLWAGASQIGMPLFYLALAFPLNLAVFIVIYRTVARWKRSKGFRLGILTGSIIGLVFLTSLLYCPYELLYFQGF